jgi:alkaline phosphatase D
VTPDDHEVENDWAGDVSRRKLPYFLQKRANAYQAYDENMPLRSMSQPKADHMHLYRTVPYGKLAQFAVLDTRQFRTEQACNNTVMAGCTEMLNPSRTMMGEAQEVWFTKSLSESKTQWNLVANQVMIAQKQNPHSLGEITFGMDGWDGYTAARARMLRAVRESRSRNPIFLTGDAHQTFVSDLKVDFNDPRSPVVTSELVGTSITSGGDGEVHSANYERFMPANTHIKYNSSRRGYFLCQVDSKKMHAEQRLTDSVTDKNAPVYGAASYTVETERKGSFKPHRSDR